MGNGSAVNGMMLACCGVMLTATLTAQLRWIAGPPDSLDARGLDAVASKGANREAGSAGRKG